MEPIKQTLKEYILREFLPGEKAETLGEDTQLIESGILDSYSILRLVQFIETTFKITVRGNEVDIDNLDTLKKIEAFVKRKIGTL